MHDNCSNCGNALTENAAFCASCGQKAHLHRLSWHDVVHDAVHYFTHADKGIFQLIKALLLKTGTVAKEFVAGKRKKYFPPLNFFLIVAAIYVLITSLNAKPVVIKDIRAAHPEIALIKDPVKQEKTYAIYSRAAKSGNFLSRNSNMIAILALPFTAFLFWLLYKRSGYNYVENLVANMYMSAFTLLVRVLIFIPLVNLFSIKMPYLELTVFFIFQLIYFTLFYYQFIGKISMGAKVKAFFSALMVIGIWFALSGFAIRIYITNGFWGLMK